MITFDEAFNKVMQFPMDLGVEAVELSNATGRVLAENIVADRDFPPFNRATKDGIAIHFNSLEKEITHFKIEAVLSAGMAQQELKDTGNCVEIMTGAVLPKNADTIIMYEDTKIENGVATIFKKPIIGQEIHRKGSDVKKGTTLLSKHMMIGAAEIGVLASVGKSIVLVNKLPKICVISTGNELVEVHETPLPHQIRRSNTLSLFAALKNHGIEAVQVHLLDDKKVIREQLSKLMEAYDVLLVSGGVSKGKFDFLPEVLELLGVEKVFHRVAQRPGKPFWFGTQQKTKTLVFSFPGNPVSTYANYHVYFLPWLYLTLQLKKPEKYVLLERPILIKPSLTRFIQVRITNKMGSLWAVPVQENGSGDLTSLANSDGFICLRPREKAYEQGEAIPFIPTK